METAVIGVEGMRCDHCKNSVESALKAIGVSSAKADVAAKSVKVEFDPAKMDIEKIKAAIDGTGFSVR